MVTYNGKTKKSLFQLELPDAQSVSLLGDFNEWNPSKHVMKKDKSGVWKTEIKLLPGEYQFLYYADQNRWITDESCPRVTSGVGSENSIAVIKADSRVKAVTKKSKMTKKK